MKQTKLTLRVFAYLICGMFLLNSCNSGDSKDATTTDSTTVTTPAAVTPPADSTTTAPAKLTDPEIASIAVTADQIDIDYAAIAKDKSKNKAVLEFASTMAKDHGSVNAKAKALAAKLNVTPQDNPITQSLLSNAETTKTMLKSKSGDDFNKAYVDNEVAYHKAAIDLVENRLIPESTNAELKALLQSALPIFKEHLAHAEMLQKQVDK